MVDCSLSNIAEVANLLLDDVTLWLEEILQTNFVSNKMLILKVNNELFYKTNQYHHHWNILYFK